MGIEEFVSIHTELMSASAQQVSASKQKQLAKEEKEVRWYVLRDLRRPNVKSRAYHALLRDKVEVFTPIKWEREKRDDKKFFIETPIIPDLLIAHSSVFRLKKYVTFQNKLQYRFLPGGYQKKMTVSDADMRRFMQAMSEASYVDYYSPDAFNPNRIGEPIVIKGGSFDGEEGVLLSVNGKKKKSIVVRLANLFVAVIELKNQEENADTTAKQSSKS